MKSHLFFLPLCLSLLAACNAMAYQPAKPAAAAKQPAESSTLTMAIAECNKYDDKPPSCWDYFSCIKAAAKQKDSTKAVKQCDDTLIKKSQNNK